jgi:hypothetical protein
LRSILRCSPSFFSSATGSLITIFSRGDVNGYKLIDKILLGKRSLIETVNDQLKNISQIEQAYLSVRGLS